LSRRAKKTHTWGDYCPFPQGQNPNSSTAHAAKQDDKNARDSVYSAQGASKATAKGIFRKDFATGNDSLRRFRNVCTEIE
jgi:hypothetical protein